ncbi:golgin candidate 3-like [Silene latifolia]|uniref:golgin candidate 3-like n=1 Tax=Silene latifolia TaxID=37657 RepID=UPI003D76E008
MWSSIANFKENLNKMALDVHDDDDDDDLYEDKHAIYGRDDRRRSHSLAHSNLSIDSPTSNGVDSPSEIERYKTEIKKVKESENELKALSVNYAALLKEKEDHIARLKQENGTLKQNLEVPNAARSPSRKDTTTTNNVNGPRGNGEQSPNRQSKVSKNRSSGNHWQNGAVSKPDGYSNGHVHGIQSDPSSKNPNLREKELADMLEEKNRILAAVQNEHESQMNKLRVELEKQRNELTDAKLKLQDEKRMSSSLRDELNSLRSNRNEASFETNNLRKEVDEKESEIKRLQMELSRRDSEGVSDTDNLRRVTARLEKENGELKVEKEKLRSELKDALRAVNQNPSSLNESLDVSASFPGKEELEQSLRKIEKDLKETRQERDKAYHELARLKQHLLDKELEESEKMDEDSKVIEELQQHVEYQKATISNLERALQQARASQEEFRIMNDHEVQKSKEIIEDLKKKLSSFMSAIDAKNTELMNLQTALGQYYAEIEAKEHLESDLSLAKEECSKLSLLLQASKQQIEGSNKEKEEMLAKLAQADKMVAEWKSRVNKLEEDNGKLRRAVEQSMTRLNRMSVDSDFLVDRRIVIKLLVTYFQRNHSKEVLDLMVRMLGFTDEDKQRIGVAQQGTGKGVVRGVLGLPGRLVGGIIGGGSGGPPTSTSTASDDQSFADLWVDFLLKENEEREKRESMEITGGSTGGAEGGKPTVTATTSLSPDRRVSSSGRPPIVSTVSTTAPLIDTSRSLYSYQNTRQYDTGSAEFSTVPLTPSGKHFS